MLDSNIVQIEDVGGSNPLCSTRRSPRTALGSRHPQSLGYVVRDRQLAGIDRGCVKTRGPRAPSFRGLWPRRAKKKSQNSSRCATIWSLLLTFRTAWTIAAVPGRSPARKECANMRL